MPPKFKPKAQHIALGFLEKENKLKDFLYIKGMDTLYLWQGGWFLNIDDSDLAEEVFHYCLSEHNELDLRPEYIRSLVQLIKWQIPNQLEKMPNRYIAFRDCLLDIKTFSTTEHNRSKPTDFYLPFDYFKLPDEHPSWTKFLETSLVEKETLQPDKELIDIVQEMFGDFLLPNLKSETAYFLVGGGANGKSKMLDIATAIIGSQFMSAMNIETLTTDKFSPPHLIGKRINISNEEESKFIKSDKFKALVTGDAITAQRKFGPSITFKSTAKFVFASNNIPTFNDLNYGMLRRIKIIPFFQKFDKNNPLTDKYILDKLMKELPAIVKWALVGAKRLVENNYNHTESVQSADALKDFENDISSAVMFFRERYIVTPMSEARTENQVLYNDYKNWCIDVGKKPMSLINFTKDLSVTFPNLRSLYGKNAEGKTTRFKNCALIDLDDEFNNVEGANTSGISIEDIPI